MEDPVVAHLLELAACNDVFRFRKSIDQNPSNVDQIGTWYMCRKGSKQMVLEHRTPLMVAATYGSIDVVKLILKSLFQVNVNKSCGQDKVTALHCAASGRSKNAVEIVEMLLAAGANPNLTDASGRWPIDVIDVLPKFQGLKRPLERLLNSIQNSPFLRRPVVRRECANVYATDEFRMFQFKVHPCTRAHAHDWTECPFFHPGENARRRDPMKYSYKSIPCADYRKGYCRKGDMCDYAHGLFECWMHPAQYRTRMCIEGKTCNRKVCFFAHSKQELRPSGFSTHAISCSPSFIPMPNAIDYAAAMNYLPYCPPVSPANYNMGWNQPHQFVNLNANGYSNAEFQQQQNILSPKTSDHSLMQASFGVSPRGKEKISPMSSKTSNLAPRESLPNWGTSSSQKTEFGETSYFGKLDGEDYYEEEPDISWVHNLVNDTTYDDDINAAAIFDSFNEGTSLSGSDDPLDPAVLKALLDQMEILDPINS